MWFLCVIVFGLIHVSLVQNVDPESLRFIDEPTDTYVLSLVNEVQLDCQATSPFGDIVYTWVKKENDGNINVVKNTTGTEMSIIYKNGNLIFRSRNILNEHNGIYQCQVSNTEGVIFSREAKLTYAVAYPAFLPRTVPIRVLEYSGFVVACPLRDFSIQDINYRWVKDGQDVSPSSLNTFISLDGRLYFSEVVQSDNGQYYCETSFRTIPGNGNYIGNASENTKTSENMTVIVVEKAPNREPFYIVKDFPKVFPAQPKLGQTIEIECVAFGELPLKYSWAKNNKTITSSNRSVLSDGNRRLTIHNVTITDEGTYSCIVVDSGGNETYMFRNIEMAGRPVFSVELSEGESLVAVSNSFLKLHCFVYAPVTPVVTWLKDGVPIKNITDRFHADSNSLILFKPTIGRDGGMYQCAARNIYGTVYSTAKITVVEPSPPSDAVVNIISLSVLALLVVFHWL